MTLGLPATATAVDMPVGIVVSLGSALEHGSGRIPHSTTLVSSNQNGDVKRELDFEERGYRKGGLCRHL